MISKLAKDLTQNNAANAAMVGGSGLALAGSTDLGQKAMEEARAAYLRRVNPATTGGRLASILGGHVAGSASDLAMNTFMANTLARYANEEGNLSDDVIRQLADSIGAPKNTKLDRVSGAMGNFATLGTEYPRIQHTGTAMASHELGHVTSPFAKLIGGPRMAMAYDVGRQNLLGMSPLIAMMEASRDYDARHGLKSSRTTKALKALNTFAVMSALPVLAEEAQASIRGYKPVKQVLGNNEARRYAGKASLAYLTYLMPAVMALTAGKQLGRTGGRAASRLLGGK